MNIGVLALQGAFAKHCQALKNLHIYSLEVRTPTDLEGCDGLIIPGGESTTLLNLMGRNGLKEAIISYTKPIYGTCAGLIVLAKQIENNEALSPLGLIDISVARNAYGRQIHSFQTELACDCGGTPFNFSAIFIRAPLIKTILSSRVEVLATHENQPVFVKQGNLFASSFHPELTEDLSIHRYFVSHVLQNRLLA